MGGDYGTNVAMPPRSPRKPRPPLGPQRLEEMALAYVGRFATSRSKLSQYLHRKVRERGWETDDRSAIDDLVERLVTRFSDLGYVDDAAFALSKSRSLSARGYGARRLRQSLQAAGIDEADSVEARAHAETQAAQSALALARRRRIGPFATTAPADPKQREKAIATMIRAGHDAALARAIVAMTPGSEPDAQTLADSIR